jgi:hypothetical protein
MTRRLVSSGDGPTLALRDHLVALVRERGSLEVRRSHARMVALRTGPWLLEHRTPFSDLATDEASSPGFRHILQQQRTAPSLPYKLKVQHAEVKVLRILWADNGTFEVVDSTRGE